MAGDSADQLAVRIGDGSALLFDAAAVANPWHLVLAPTVLTLTIVLVFVTLLSIYAVRWITEPLSSVAAAPQSFGRSPDASRIVSRGGPREIAQVQDALHELPLRLLSLLDARTRNLAATTPALHTPLPRLQMGDHQWTR